MTSSVLPGSWVKVAAIIAALFLLSTVWVLQLNTSVRSEVERLRGSLLGCDDSKSSREDGEVVEEMATGEKCVYEYNLTLSFESTMGRTVMLDRWGVELMCSILRPDMEVLEYGSGGSTTFFSQFVKSWTSMEHDSNWEPKVKNTLNKLPWGDRVTLYLVPRDMPSKSFEGNEEEYRSYIDKPASLGRQWDLIIDDGRARVGVGRGVVNHHLLAAGGRLMIHDWERKEYKQLVTNVGFTVDREDKKSKRHMAILKLE